jgi:hypothetical protein
LSLHVVLALTLAPAFLSHINLFFGGNRQGNRYFADSSYDWGQDMVVLSNWMDENLEDEVAQLAIFAPMKPSWYGIEGDVIFQMGAGFPRGASLPELRPGVIAASATILAGPYFRVEGTGWSEANERAYWMSRRLISQVVEEAGQDPEAWLRVIASQPEIPWVSVIETYSRLRIKRFLHILQPEELLARPADTIFIWRLSLEAFEASGFPGEPHLPASFPLPELMHYLRQQQISEPGRP